MIELDRTDEEREELVKQWIKDNWLSTVGVIALAIGIVYGVDYYRQSQEQQLSANAAQTEQIMQALKADKLDIANKQLAILQENEKNTSFSSVATLATGKKLFELGKYEEAVQQYEWLINNIDDIAMRDVARLRKARAEANLKQYQQAISTLNGLEGDKNLAEASILRADILTADNKIDEALQELEELKASGYENIPMLEQHINLLTIKKQQSK